MNVGTAVLPPCIRVENVAFGYGQRELFSGLGFTIPTGNVYGLVGRSGIGKTTLLNLLLGLYRPRRGTISLGAAEPVSPGAIRGAVFREPSLLGWLTVEQNILFPEHMHPSVEARGRVRELLAAADLKDSGKLLPKELSAGMAKRVELLRAWCADEVYFVGDEPFSALDLHTRARLHELWLRLRAERPRTGILCTHDPAEASWLCDRILILHRDTGGATVLSEFTPPVESRRRSATDRFADPFTRQIAALIQ